MCLICEIILICSMLTLPSGAILEFETFLRSFLRAFDAVTYDIRNIPCSASMRNFSRAADIGICKIFLAFHKVKMLSLTVFVAFQKPHMLSFALVPPFQKLHMLLLANFSQYSQPSKSRNQSPADQEIRGPEDQGTRGPGDQRTRGPEDQGTRGPGDQRMRGPEDQGLRAGSTGPKDHGTRGPALTPEPKPSQP